MVNKAKEAKKKADEAREARDAANDRYAQYRKNAPKRTRAAPKNPEPKKAKTEQDLVEARKLYNRNRMLARHGRGESLAFNRDSMVRYNLSYRGKPVEPFNVNKITENQIRGPPEPIFENNPGPPPFNVDKADDTVLSFKDMVIQLAQVGGKAHISTCNSIFKLIDPKHTVKEGLVGIPDFVAVLNDFPKVIKAIEDEQKRKEAWVKSHPNEDPKAINRPQPGTSMHNKYKSLTYLCDHVHSKTKVKGAAKAAYILKGQYWEPIGAKHSEENEIDPKKAVYHWEDFKSVMIEKYGDVSQWALWLYLDEDCVFRGPDLSKILIVDFKQDIPKEQIDTKGKPHRTNTLVLYEDKTEGRKASNLNPHFELVTYKTIKIANANSIVPTSHRQNLSPENQKRVINFIKDKRKWLYCKPGDITQAWGWLGPDGMCKAFQKALNDAFGEKIDISDLRNSLITYKRAAILSNPDLSADEKKQAIGELAIIAKHGTIADKRYTRVIKRFVKKGGVIPDSDDEEEDDKNEDDENDYDEENDEEEYRPAKANTNGAKLTKTGKVRKPRSTKAEMEAKRKAKGK